MAEPALQVRNAVVSYRHNTALKGVSLSVQAGEFVGIIGPNGAGKSTLITAINGITKIRSGSVQLLGQELTPQSSHSLRKRVGYVSQLENIDPRMPLNVRDAVMIGRYGRLGLLKTPGKQDWALVDEMIKQVGMTNLARRPIGHLSGGERQRAAIARCLAQEPELFLLDEPTASLDWKAQAEILALVKLIHAERHLTTLFVTHDLNALPLACSRIVLMKSGVIWNDGPPQEMLADNNLSLLYDLPPATVRERRAVNAG